MRLIRLNEDNIVIGWQIAKGNIEGMIESNVGQRGQRYLGNDTFEDVPLKDWEKQRNRLHVLYLAVVADNSFTAEQFEEITGEVFIAEV
jgi:hypothetical protein